MTRIPNTDRSCDQLVFLDLEFEMLLPDLLSTLQKSSTKFQYGKFIHSHHNYPYE
jgi:hypothetical protein